LSRLQHLRVQPVMSPEGSNATAAQVLLQERKSSSQTRTLSLLAPQSDWLSLRLWTSYLNWLRVFGNEAAHHKNEQHIPAAIGSDDLALCPFAIKRVLDFRIAWLRHTNPSTNAHNLHRCLQGYRNRSYHGLDWRLGLCFLRAIMDSSCRFGLDGNWTLPPQPASSRAFSTSRLMRRRRGVEFDHWALRFRIAPLVLVALH
jgi:hypothetical protein